MLAAWCGRSPEKITEAQLREYFLYLKNEKQFTPGSLKVACAGVKFCFTHTVPRSWQVLEKLRIPKQKTLPDVLTVDEVLALIDAVRTQRNAVYLWTVYSLGLRLEEGLNLQVGDVDSQRMMVHVHRGKGAKDRYVPLPTSTLAALRTYWSTHRHRRLLFRGGWPGRNTPVTSVLWLAPSGAVNASSGMISAPVFGRALPSHGGSRPGHPGSAALHFE